jgi:methionyl-tRNA formyltransferase
MKIVILTIKNPGNIYLTNILSKEFVISGMVILRDKKKTFQEKLSYWCKIIRRYGIFKTLNKYMYLKLGIKWCGNGKESSERFFSNNDYEIEYNFKTNILETYDINSDQVMKFISELAPDSIAVCGSKVIKAKIFKLAPNGTVNIHCGIVPEYRSANPVEWALINRDFDKIGVTIHFVNEGVDTGKVLYQQKISVKTGDTISSIYAQNIKIGAELMVRALKDIELGKVSATDQALDKGKHYLSIEYGIIQNFKAKRILNSI